jgi:PST family polysaccharide transporter
LKDASLNGADAELKEGYVQSVRISAAVALPAGLGMAALSLPIVLTFYGSEWRPSAGPMALVAIWAAISTLDQLPGVVFKATGRAWLLTLTSVIQISLILPAIWFGAYFGFTAVAAAQVIERTISLGILGIFVGRVLKIPWFTTFTASAPLLVPSLAMVAVIYPMTLVLPPAVALVLAVPVGLLVYAGLLRVCAPSLYHTLVTPAWRTVRARIRPTATSEAQPQLTQGGAQS